MPNHVHVLIAPKESLFKIVQSEVVYGALGDEKNAELGLGVSEGVLMREYWDRYIRDERHFQQVVDYIHRNPVKAGLCREPQDWPWSNAHAFSANDCRYERLK
jgi:REP element-mobilizing transposase RayT